MRYYLDLFGCVKNQVDAENMMSCLNAAGWEAASGAEDAGIIIVNSCGFIESAKQESINAVLGWRKLYPGKKILLAGCLAQRYKPELSEALPEADLLFGNTDPGGIVEALEKLCGKKPKDRALQENTLPGKRPLLSPPGQAYVKISEGCDNRCSFCAIPLIRGSLKSRTIDDVVEECKTLLERGIKELCLIGQDLGSYGVDLKGKQELPSLLKKISALKGDFWVRLLYIHPDNFPVPIIGIMEKDRRFLPYFDIPFQHASGKILKAMNRRQESRAYMLLITLIRVKLPDAVIRSSFMTGFPGESDEDFAALLDFQEKVKPDWAGFFTYSREEGTASYNMKNRVSKRLAAERRRLLEEKQIPISEKRMERFVGKEALCLVEEKIEGEEGLYLGRLPWQAPEVDGAAVISSDRELVPGSFVHGKIFARAGFDLQVSV
jgi:ribosomal protein S12 methylthiotransferase